MLRDDEIQIKFEKMLNIKSKTSIEERFLRDLTKLGIFFASKINASEGGELFKAIIRAISLFCGYLFKDFNIFDSIELGFNDFNKTRRYGKQFEKSLNFFSLCEAVIEKYRLLLNKFNYDFNEIENIKNFACSVFNLIIILSQGIEMDDDHLKDYLEISLLLSDKKRCKQAVGWLETDLQKYATKHNIVLAPYNEGLSKLPEPIKNPYERKKILSGFLYQWAKDNGYNAEHYAVINRELSSQEFYNLMREKIVFDDRGAGRKHGPLSHLIQQYFIVESNKRLKFLTFSPAELYSHIALVKVGNTENPGVLWNILFDKTTDDINHPSDFSCPDAIVSKLKHNAKGIHLGLSKYPLLTESIRRLYQKDKDKRIDLEAPVEEVLAVKYKPYR